jgi:hypothetical protein
MSWFSKKMACLAMVKALSHWDHDSKMRLCGRLDMLHQSYNDIVIEQGQEPQHVYLLHSGECRLVKRYEGHEMARTNHALKTTTTTTSTAAAAAAAATIASVPSASAVSEVALPICIELGTIHRGQIFGSFELLQGHTTRQFSVLVSSPSAVVYRLDKFGTFTRRDPSMMYVVFVSYISHVHIVL